jgi:hypothetical protein
MSLLRLTSSLCHHECYVNGWNVDYLWLRNPRRAAALR